MDHFEMVEKLQQKANVTFEEARAALEQCDWDLLDALVLLENQGKVHTENGASQYTTQDKQQDAQSFNTTKTRTEFSGGMNRLWNFLKGLFQKGNANQFVITRKNEELIAMPVTVLVLILLCAWPFSAIALFVGLFLGARYSFRGPNISQKVNDAMKQAANVVQGDEGSKVE